VIGASPDPAVPEVLGVLQVMARYGLRDPRSARRVMDEAGAFIIGGRLLVRRDDLLGHEETLRVARRPGALPEGGGTAEPSRGNRKGARRRRSAPREPLRPGWWRTDAP
jgi:hypothetical protein